MVRLLMKRRGGSAAAWVPLALCAVLAGASTLPAQGTTAKDKVGQFVDSILDSDVELKVPLRRSKIIRMKQDVFRVAMADPSILEVVAFGSREIEIIGKETGSTTVTLWLGEPAQAQILTMLVSVTKDDKVEDRRRYEYGELQTMINELFPNSKVQLIPVADKLIVRGEARDEEEMTQILSVLRKGGGSLPGAGGGGNSGSQLVNGGAAADPFPDALQLPSSTIVNMLRVPGEKQVMLKVRIAEMKRSAARNLGADFDVSFKEFFLASGLAGGGNIMASGLFSEGSFSFFLKASIANGNAKILAEPNLVVLSGQTANFLAGGEFAVPTVVGVGGAQAATTSFKGFGTSINFTPAVLDKDRIRLNVSPSFSTLNKSNSVGGVFGVDTRTVQTTVEMREGQVLAIAGLLQEQQRGDKTWVPILGELPVLSVPFSNKSISRDETELIILVTPELVHPLEPEDAPTLLPGMEVTEPDDVEFFVRGHIEGKPNCHHRSTVWALYRDRLCKCRKNYEQYRSSEDYYIQGPHGFSE